METEQMQVIPPSQPPYGTVSIIGGNFDEYYKLLQEAKEAHEKLNGFTLKLEYAAKRVS